MCETTPVSRKRRGDEYNEDDHLKHRRIGKTIKKRVCVQRTENRSIKGAVDQLYGKKKRG